MSVDINSAAYKLAQQRIQDFQSNSEFKDYDIYFVSGVLEGLNERRRFIKNANVVTRCSFTKDGLLDTTSLDLGWEIDLIEDIFKNSIAGDDNSFVGSDHNLNIQSGVFLSMRLLNMFRYYTVETSFGALTTFDGFLTNPALTYDLGSQLLPPTIDNKYFGQMYRTYNSNTSRHYPCAESNGGDPALLANPKISTRTNAVDVYANPLVREDAKQPVHGTFYNEPSDLAVASASGYPGNGDLGILRAIDQVRNNPTEWPVKDFQGVLVPQKIISDFNDEVYPPDNTWALWTNKRELFSFEQKFYHEKGVPTSFILRNEYFSSVFPVTEQPSGHAFLGIREFFAELIDAIGKMAYFGIRMQHLAVTEGENPLTVDLYGDSASASSNFGSCDYAPGPCDGHTTFFCDFTSGPKCCSALYPSRIFPQLQCGDCGAYKCAPDGCLGPSIDVVTQTVSLFVNPFPDTPDPIYYTKTSAARGDFQGSTVFGGCPINTLATNGSETMRAKRIVFNYAFTGRAIQPYRRDRFTTTTCDGFAVSDGCVAGVDSLVDYANVTYTFPAAASNNGHGGASVTDTTPNQVIPPYNNCTHTCLPGSVGGGGRTLDYRQYASPIAVAIPTFLMIPSTV